MSQKKPNCNSAEENKDNISAKSKETTQSDLPENLFLDTPKITERRRDRKATEKKEVQQTIALKTHINSIRNN